MRAAIESMNGARFVHDQLELAGWQVAIADAQKVKGLAPWPARPTGSMPGCWPSGTGTVSAASGPPPHRAQEPHPRHPAGLWQPCPVGDLLGAGGRQLLARLASPEPWAGNVAVALALIDDLDDQIDGCERDLRHLGADHPSVPLLMTAPGIAWVLGYPIAAELGDIARFPSPKKLCGYSGLCPRVDQSSGPRSAWPAGQERPALSGLGADRGGHPRRPSSLLPRPLPAHQAAAWPPARPQGGPGGGRPQAHRGHLAQAHPTAALCSGKAPYQRSGRLTTLV